MSELLSIPCDLLADNKVKNAAGEDIGRVEELIVHPRTGAVSHAIVAFGGFLGASDRMFAVPWNALDLDPRTRTFHLRVDRLTLRNAPKFSRDQRQSVDDAYLSDVDAHYSGNNSLQGCFSACTAA